MAFLGLSGSALTFLGGVAQGASKELDRQIEAQQEAIKAASSAAIRQRLANRKKYDDSIEEMKKEIQPLLSQYNIPNVAALMSLPQAQRNKIVSSLATIDGKDNRAKFFKALDEFKGKTDLTESELINALVPAYKEAKMDYSDLVPKTAADVLFGQDPKNLLETRIKAGVGNLRPSVERKDLTPFQQGLSREGKIKVFAEDAKDLSLFRKSFTKNIFTRMGGKAVETQFGVFRAAEGKDADLTLAESFVSKTLVPIYNNKVRELQIDENLSLIEAQTKAQSMITNQINSQLSVDDTAGNAAKIREQMGVKPISIPDTYDGLFQEKDKVALSGLLALQENRFAEKFGKGQRIGPEFYNEAEGDIRERLLTLGYDEKQIKDILSVFRKKIRKYTSSDTD